MEMRLLQVYLINSVLTLYKHANISHTQKRKDRNKASPNPEHKQK